MRTQECGVIQSNNSKLTLQVMNDLTVQLYTNPKFDFLMDNKTVARGYGVADSTIKSNKSNHSDELIEGKHFVYGSAVQNLDGRADIRPNMIFWTKAGVIRLGFFIKSDRAKLFRDWAENVILNVIAKPVSLPPVTKRRHNRLSQERLVGILADVARIDDRELRLSLISKLGV